MVLAYGNTFQTARYSVLQQDGTIALDLHRNQRIGILDKFSNLLQATILVNEP